MQVPRHAPHPPAAGGLARADDHRRRAHLAPHRVSLRARASGSSWPARSSLTGYEAALRDAQSHRVQKCPTVAHALGSEPHLLLSGAVRGGCTLATSHPGESGALCAAPALTSSRSRAYVAVALDKLKLTPPSRLRQGERGLLDPVGDDQRRLRAYRVRGLRSAKPAFLCAARSCARLACPARARPSPAT